MARAAAANKAHNGAAVPRASRGRGRLLWLDNSIDSFGAIISALREVVDVDCAQSSSEAIKLIKQNEYDAYFVDFILDGEIGRSSQVVKTILRRDRAAFIVFVSGYLSIPEIDSQVRKFKVEFPEAQIRQVDKVDLPVPGERAFAEFARVVSEFRGSKKRLLVGKWRSPGATGKGSFDFPGFADFEGLTRAEQSKFVDEMFVRHKPALEKLFAEGAIWVLYCGSWDEPVAKALRFEEVWPDERAIDHGASLGYAPIAFSNVQTVDDYSSAQCSREARIDGYPAVKIERSVPQNGMDSFHVHFDTGNPVSMICDRTYTKAGWLSERRMSFHSAMIGGQKQSVRAFELPDTQATDSVGRVVPFSFAGLAIENWDETRFAVQCRQDCRNTIRRINKRCFYRTALLGRNFQIATKVWIGVDCSRGAIRFGEPIS